MSRWTGLAPWDFEFPFPGSLTSTFLAGEGHIHGAGQLDPPAAALRVGPQRPHYPRHPPSQGNLSAVLNPLYL